MIYHQTWQGRVLSGKADHAWFPASVPGNIQYDYGVAHDFGDPDYMDNYTQYLPLEDVTWQYRAILSCDQKPGEQVWFVSGGVDYRYEIALNGEKLYAYEGMYRPVELNLTGKLQGHDELTVTVFPHPKRPDAAAGTRDEADQSCKPPVSYSWDWNPRLLISGMWEDAYLETRGPDFLRSCEPIARLDDSLTVGTVDFLTDCDVPVTYTLTDMDGKVVYSGSDPHVTVANPRLWWCNGQGEQYLYAWTAKTAENEKSGVLGFKRLRLVRNTGADDPHVFPKSRYDAPVTVELNGRRILAKGSNWVNPELFFGRADRKRYEELLVPARDAHMNMLRVWGGSGIYKEDFYDLCDRLGILVWQEFMLACNKYPDSPAYLTVLESEGSAVIRRLRRHACLALWCGGNELFNSWSGMDDQSLPLRLLDKLCYELDPGRPFMKTSPLTGMAHGGYTFRHPAMDGDVFHAIRHAHHTAYTEFGVPSLTDLDTLRKIIPEDELFPVKPTKAWIDRHGLEAWGDNSWICPDTLAYYFGKAESLEELVEQSVVLECAGYQAMFEEMRRQWPHCSMMMNWCYDEPWSNAANNCLLCYPARPKKAYYAVQNALRPTAFSAGMEKYDWTEGEDFSADLWLLNDAPETVRGSVTAELVTAEGTTRLLVWDAENTAPNSNRRGPTVHVTLPESAGDFFTLRLLAADGRENEYRLLLRHRDRTVRKVRTMNL